jgi:hypothetical protein
MENECLWATEILFLNDPSETYYIESLINQICEKSPTTINIFNYFYNESYKSFFFDSTSKYITSMSTERDSLSMWNYYSKGMAIVLNLRNQSYLKNILLMILSQISQEKKNSYDVTPVKY